VLTNVNVAEDISKHKMLSDMMERPKIGLNAMANENPAVNTLGEAI
jgi:hypothetical protein